MRDIRKLLVTVLSGGADTTAPTVEITSESSGTTAGAFTCTFTFSEDVTGFEIGDITVSANASAGTFAGSGAVYTAVITPSEIGTITVDVAAEVAEDATGNLNTAATQFSIFCTTKVAGAITPTLGDEMVANGNMEDANPPAGWTTSNATLAQVADERTGGAGSNSMSLTNSAAAFGGAYRTLTTDQATWLSANAWAKRVTASTSLQLRSSADAQLAQTATTSTSWTQTSTITTRMIGTNGRVFFGNASNTSGHESRYDDLTVKPITFSTMRADVGEASAKNGTYQCAPTSPGGGQTGILIEYLDDNNFVMLVLDRGNGSNAQLVSRIAGTYTVARTGSVTYGAAKLLKCVVNGTTHQLFYDNVQVGADVTIDNSGMGLGVHAFNSLAGNTVGTVTVNP